MKKNAQERHWQGGAGRYTLDLSDLDQNSEGGNYAIIDIETDQSIWEVKLGWESAGSGWAPDLVGAQHAVEEWLNENVSKDSDATEPTPDVRPPMVGKKVKAQEAQNTYRVYSSGEFLVRAAGSDTLEAASDSPELLQWSSSYSKDLGTFTNYRKAVEAAESEEALVYEAEHNEEPNAGAANQVTIDDDITGELRHTALVGVKGQWGWSFHVNFTENTQYTSRQLGYDISAGPPGTEAPEEDDEDTEDPEEPPEAEEGTPRPPLLGKKVKAMEEQDFDADWKDQREPPQDPDAGYEDWEEVQEKLFRYESPYGAEAYVKQLDKDKFIWTVWPEGIGKVEGPTGETASFEDAKNKALSNMRGSKSFEKPETKVCPNCTGEKFVHEKLENRGTGNYVEHTVPCDMCAGKGYIDEKDLEDYKKKVLPPEVVKQIEEPRVKPSILPKKKPGIPRVLPSGIPSEEYAYGAPSPEELSQMIRLQKMIRQCGWKQLDEHNWELDIGTAEARVSALTQGFMWETYDMNDVLLESGTAMDLDTAKASAKMALGTTLDLSEIAMRQAAAGTIPWKTFGALAFASIPGIGMAEVKWDVEKKTWVWFLSYKGQKHTGTAESQSEGQDIVAQKFESLSPVPVMAKVIRVDANGELRLRYKVGANVLLKGRPFTVVAAAPPGKAFARNGVRAPLLVSPEGSRVLVAVGHEDLSPVK